MKDRSKEWQFDGWCIVMDLKESVGTQSNRRVKHINNVVRYLNMDSESDRAKHYRKGIEEGLKAVEVSRLEDLMTSEEVVRHLNRMPLKKK